MSNIGRNVLSLGPEYTRDRPECVSESLHRLGVQAPASFVDFYARFKGPFGSATSGYLLLDLCAAGDDGIVAATGEARAHFALPEEMVVITNLLGGEVLVYATDTDEVFEMDFEGGERVVSSRSVAPRWRSFSDFLASFFSGLPELG